MIGDLEEVTSSSFVAPLLPPCRVCGDKASGFHYGANTCEACKGFFRRSLQRKEDYKCSANGICDVGPGNRSTCAYCRYQKCLSVGMSKSAIKTGRYTHEKKTRDIEEVKRLQQQQKMQMDGTLIQTLGENKEQELEKIIRCITLVHLQQTPHTPEFFEKLPQREKEFMEQRELQQQMFGTLKPLPREEYMRIYQTTGIDVDGRREMIKHMIPCLEKAIKRFISFAKALPGFQDLPIEDQIALIKVSYFEGWLISAYRAFNADLKLFTHVCGYTLHKEQLSRLEDPDFLEALFAVANRLKKLNLGVDEECLLKGIMLLASDKCALKDVEGVERCQIILVEALEFICSNRHPRDRLRFGRILGLLADIRALADRHQALEVKIGMDWSGELRIPALVYEIFSG